ncbi:hypothetical protein [Algivirga pacifica]|uniref:NfeD-like C-terminal domain-containing protein n=1 Tax=Algivirga pacifica TaxID=1162670 RepID=A0ABP9D210_9BACT
METIKKLLKTIIVLTILAGIIHYNQDLWTLAKGIAPALCIFMGMVWFILHGAKKKAVKKEEEKATTKEKEELVLAENIFETMDNWSTLASGTKVGSKVLKKENGKETLLTVTLVEKALQA